MGVHSWSVTARPWKLPSLNFCQHWNSINQISKLFEHFFQSSVMIVDDWTEGGFSALIWKELGNNGHHPELHSRKLCQKDSWKSSWNSLKGRNIFKLPSRLYFKENYVVCVFFVFPGSRDFQNKHGPRGPQPLQSEASYEKVPPFSRRRWWHVGSTKGGEKHGEGATRWTERFHLQSDNPTKELRKFLKLDRFSFLKPEIETIHYGYKNPTIQQVLNSNKNNQWSDGGVELVWLDAKQTLQAKKNNTKEFVSGSASSPKKKIFQLFRGGNLPSQPMKRLVFAVSNGFNPPWTFSLVNGAPKIRVGSWCPLASGFLWNEARMPWKSHGAFQKGIPKTWLVVEPTHLKNMLVKMGSSSPNRDEHKKIFETTTGSASFFEGHAFSSLTVWKFSGGYPWIPVKHVKFHRCTLKNGSWKLGSMVLPSKTSCVGLTKEMSNSRWKLKIQDNVNWLSHDCDERFVRSWNGKWLNF